MINEKQRQFAINFIFYIICFICVLFVGISNACAIAITDYATKYYWGEANSMSITETAYRTGIDNKLTLYPGTAPTYDNAETFNGFYNRINYTISKGSIYTISLAISFSSLQSSEWGLNNVNNRLLNINFAHCSNGTVTAVSGSIRTYNSTNQSISGLYDYVVQMSYTFVATSNASTWYIGSYTGDDRTMGVYQHSYTSIVMVNNLDISNDNSSTIINQNDTIINQNQQLLDQNQQNTQEIINNQNQNTQEQIESQKVCNTINKSYIYQDNKFLTSSGSLNASSYFGLTDYININNSTIEVLQTQTNSDVYYCYYDIDKTKIQCSANNTLSGTLTIPNNAYYVRFSLHKSTNKPQLKICTNGNQALNDNISNLDDTLKDDDVSGAENEASDFFSGFNTNTFGLTSIITAPLNLIQSLTSSTCTQLHLPLPYLSNQYLDLPCMTSIYQQHFGTFFTMYQTITYGIIAYWVCVRIFNQVKDFKNPEHDEIEVVDL